MPGFSFIINNKPQFTNLKIDSLKKNLCLEDHEKITVVKDLQHAKVLYTSHINYPIKIFEYSNFFFIIEGMIYNCKEEVLIDRLKKIADLFLSGNSGYKVLITEFVNYVDGDFLIAISDRNCENLIFFNDYLGRIPLYFSHDEETTIISRDIKTILEYSSSIILRKSSIVDFITLGYLLGNKSFFEGVYKLFPSQIIEVKKSNESSLRIFYSNECNFILADPFTSKNKSLVELKETFIESVKNRVTFLQERKVKMICDLSGGFDSRTILGGLSKFSNELTYYNFQYIRDESPWARAIFDKFEEPGKFDKLSFNNAIDYASLNNLIYKTDGLVNFYSTAICYSDLKYLFGINPEITARFGGLAGEFIRHPLKNYYKSIYWGIENGLYSSTKPEFGCKIINLSYQNYKEETISYLGSYKEKSVNDKLKHFYNEYYQNMVGGAAEDRERIHFWSMHPLWSKDFMRLINNRIPLNWTGFSFYTEFMRQINPVLLEVPIYDNQINLKSFKGKIIFDLLYKINSQKTKNYLIIKERLGSFYSFYAKHLKTKIK